MKKIKAFESDACGYFVRVKKDIHLPKLQKLCRNITHKLIENGYYESSVNFDISENDVKIDITMREFNDDIIGKVGVMSKPIDCDADYYELYPFRSNAVIEHWSEEDWVDLCHSVQECILETLCS